MLPNALITPGPGVFVSTTAFPAPGLSTGETMFPGVWAVITALPIVKLGTTVKGQVTGTNGQPYASTAQVGEAATRTSTVAGGRRAGS